MDRMNIRVWQGFFMPVVISTSNDSRRACNYVDKCHTWLEKKGDQTNLGFLVFRKTKKKIHRENVCQKCVYLFILHFSQV